MRTKALPNANDDHLIISNRHTGTSKQRDKHRCGCMVYIERLPSCWLIRQARIFSYSITVIPTGICHRELTKNDICAGAFGKSPIDVHHLDTDII